MTVHVPAPTATVAANCVTSAVQLPRPVTKNLQIPHALLNPLRLLFAIQANRGETQVAKKCMTWAKTQVIPGATTAASRGGLGALTTFIRLYLTSATAAINFVHLYAAMALPWPNYPLFFSRCRPFFRRLCRGVAKTTGGRQTMNNE